MLNIVYCGKDLEDPSIPTPPIWHQKSLPNEWPETGIDAHESKGIIVEWEPSEENDVVAYHIYRAIVFSDGSMDNFRLISSTGAQTFSFVDTTAGALTRYYYKLQAEDVAGNISQFSESITYLLLNSIANSGMYPNGRDEKITDNKLMWFYEYYMAMENYCITIILDDNSLVLREEFQPLNYSGRIEEWFIPDSISFIENRVYKWRIDVHSDYTEGVETSGGESGWAYFIY